MQSANIVEDAPPTLPADYGKVKARSNWSAPFKKPIVLIVEKITLL
jgi:hypothetical protein